MIDQHLAFSMILDKFNSIFTGITFTSIEVKVTFSNSEINTLWIFSTSNWKTRECLTREELIDLIGVNLIPMIDCISNHS